MASVVKLRTDFSSVDLPRLAKKSRDGYRAWRLLALAAVFDGMNRAEAAQIDGMDRQTLRDWVHRFNTEGPEGLLDHKAAGGVPRLSPEQKAELSQLVETGPDFGVDGVVRWQRVDLQCVIKQRFGVEYHERYVGKILKSLGVERVIFPEIEIATELADRMTWPNVLDFMPIDPEYSFAEITTPPSLAGKTLREADLRKSAGISVVGIKDAMTGKLQIFPDGEFKLSDDQMLVVVGRQTDLNKLREME